VIDHCLLIRRLTLAILLTAGACGRPSSPQRLWKAGERQASLPSRMLWAWERPEDLRFIDPHRFGVALLAATLHLVGNDVRVRPRLQPISVPPECPTVAVIHIESDTRQRPLLNAALRRAVLRSILHQMKDTRAKALQIDFDARQSERTFYHDLLFDLRGSLPYSTGLAMTALASWCLDDDWLESLPVDEAIPMLFRMGADALTIRAALTAGANFRSPLCRQSWGVATDEPLPLILSGRRLYLFSSRPWSRMELARIMQRTEAQP